MVKIENHHHLIAFNSCFFPVPGHSPDPIEVFNTSSTSLRAKWGEVPKKFRYGAILGYRVSLALSSPSYKALEMRNFTISDPRDTVFDKLEKFTEYLVEVLAYSSLGDGVAGNAIATTDEDSKLLPSNDWVKYSKTWQLIDTDSNKADLRGFVKVISTTNNC